METNSINKGKRVLFVVLPLIVLASLSLWYIRNIYRVKAQEMIRVESTESVYDLRDIDFATGFARLQGEVKYIPGVLTPKEYVAREDEETAGACWKLPAATSRIIIRVPDDSVYMITKSSIDYAHKVYINGKLRFQAGVPADNKEDFEPGCAQMTLEAEPENGIIEIIQQGANFVHREGGGHSNLYFGKAEIIQPFLAMTFGPEYITVGLFISLFFVHLVLYVVRVSYKPNLIFSMLCLTWAVRTGVTGAKVFFAMFPSMPWQAAFRAEYLALPIASVLMVLLVREVFPGVPQKWFVRIVAAVSAVFSVLCLTVDTVLLSWMLMPFEVFFTLAIIYLCVRFIMKVPGMVKEDKFQIEQTVSLIGFVFFMAATVNDALHHLSVPYYLGIKNSFIMTGLAMLIFSFFQMTAMFYGTMRETAIARDRERRAEAENEVLSEMNRLKSAFYTDMSHEMKTPLTVIAVNAQFAAQNIGAGVVDEETVMDLNAISAEAKRLAQMVTSLVGIGRMQGDEGGCFLLTPLLNETAHIYQSLFARRKNILSVEAASDLPFIEGSTDQLMQVLINLLSNANRHTYGGEVIVKAEIQDGQVRVSVTDNGEGIAPELLPHVFERFCHGEKGGSGLGLPICKTIIEEHGGKIGIESKEGVGTQVWFALPIKEETEDEGNRHDPAGRG